MPMLERENTSKSNRVIPAAQNMSDRGLVRGALLIATALTVGAVVPAARAQAALSVIQTPTNHSFGGQAACLRGRLHPAGPDVYSWPRADRDYSEWMAHGAWLTDGGPADRLCPHDQ